MDLDIAGMIADYNTGKMTCKAIGKKYGCCTGKAYYILRDAGCEFSKRTKKEKTELEKAAEFLRRSLAHKGKKLSEAQINAISERNSCNYNGMNGYGHTKYHTGYIKCYVPKHPNASKDGYVMLHRVLMERQIGRYLNDDEVVHHINHKRDDNRLENLRLMNKRDHMSMHMKERWDGLSIT